ncbi:hypothetical protein Ae201684P_010862 [Aphanomyces euteiches]|uniref:DDE-1 domain-containing protein n=1 Tax=Aphanomyces euteiches TaxID=100861 RepID=A0A6G0WI67_9STRA|nr:hypothetical protein Ae201684_014893 [Aphanomyces euteiches]KAH9076933.1 hypothetical protein Ae201684P_010862 [Aphanomyces euteiches]KAH9140506.1 hypothetical protein AeRB84_015259 [Aphanomyces euteiches]
MINFLRVTHNQWLVGYISTCSSGFASLQRLLEHFADRHSFSEQRICHQKRTQTDLDDTRRVFAQWFHQTYADLLNDCLYNADETGIYNDMCPNTIWAVRGGVSYVENAETHSYRMTALITNRADGQKLPIVFIIRGVACGKIESTEREDYPRDHFYAMQEKAWMNGFIWKRYLRRQF